MDLFDPYKFALQRLHLKRDSGHPLGFSVSYVRDGVYRVIKVIDGEAAAKAGVEKDTYLLAVDGDRINSEKEFKRIDKTDKETFYMAFAKRRSSPLQPGSFPLPQSVEKKAGHEYTCC